MQIYLSHIQLHTIAHKLPYTIGKIYKMRIRLSASLPLSFCRLQAIDFNQATSNTATSTTTNNICVGQLQMFSCSLLTIGTQVLVEWLWVNTFVISDKPRATLLREAEFRFHLVPCWPFSSSSSCSSSSSSSSFLSFLNLTLTLHSFPFSSTSSSSFFSSISLF